MAEQRAGIRKEALIVRQRRTIAELKIQLRLVSMLAADTPQFFNPLVAFDAKKIRDRVLAEAK